MQRTLKLQMQGLGQSDLPFILLLDTEGRKHSAETLRAVKDMVLLYGNMVLLYCNMVLLYGNIPLSSLVQYPHQGACIWSAAYHIP